ncbi:MAG: prephenate dehydratase [candidate division KSB1 bacterium]|nr:prephenate dehydratase [candidate division KSB1 bacterium]
MTMTIWRTETLNMAIPKVAFQGARYAFSEMASQKFFGKEIECIPCKTFQTVFERVEKGDADYGVVPVENSLTGSIHRNIDLLLEHDIHIIGEVHLRVAQHLIACPGVQMQDIHMIYSHPQALEQCRSFLMSLKDVEPIASYDTAGSVKMIRDKKMMDAAAIGSRWAARDYGMTILKEEVEDIPENYTRFNVLSLRDEPLKAPTKTSVVFAMKSIPGALFKSLSVFALRDIDLVKIESRPLRGRPWEYIFYLDFVGSMQEERSQNAIRHLKEITSMIRVLGSYPAANRNGNEQ